MLRVSRFLQPLALLPDQFRPGQRGSQLIHDAIWEVFDELWIGCVELLRLARQPPALVIAGADASVRKLLALHEREETEHDLVDAPSRRPKLRVVVAEGHADGASQVEPSVRGDHEDFGGLERVRRWELQLSVVEASLVGAVGEAEDYEVPRKDILCLWSGVKVCVILAP